MNPANTICVSQEGPANALALNKDSTQVVIAGRNVFKVFAIGENEFSEVCNLRVGKNLNLNFSSIDVAWSSVDENTLATAATNGAVVVWNLGRSARSKQEHVFSDHKRTVNKVSFHLTDPSLLISGSQDGMMKCFDLRMKEVARTFISNTESIRDVQFSPSQPNSFAAVSENGSVQVWDVRRHERCLQQFTAHSGPVFACDWHPTQPWLATASRDKTIKVWDMNAKPNLEYTIYTIASVGHVKWRPQKKYHVSSCALVLDCAVHVWDVRRPHVPLATFAEHRDVTTAIAWLPGPHAFLSTSRDCSLYRHRFQEAAHPVLWGAGHALAVSARAGLCRARPERPLARPEPNALLRPDRHLPGLGRKQPTAGSLTASAQATLEKAFPSGAASILTRYEALSESPHAGFLGCAREYRISGAPPHELAEHNARVARKYNRHLVGHVWDVVRAEWLHVAGRGGRGGASVAGGRGAGAGGAARGAAPNMGDDPPPTHAYNSVVEEEECVSSSVSWADTEHSFRVSGVLGLPTHSIYIPPAKFAKHCPNDEAVWVSAATAHYVDIDAMEWTLPEEAFPLRAHQPNQANFPNQDLNNLAGGVEAGAGPAGGSSPDSSGSSDGHHHGQVVYCVVSPQSEQDPLEAAELEGGGAQALSVGGQASGGPGRAFSAAGALAGALAAHAGLGDVQTSAAVLLAIDQHRSELFPYIDESVQEQWLLGYIEMLQRHKLWNVAAMVVRSSWIVSVWVLSQQSSSVALLCGRCGRRSRPHQPCERCEPRGQDLCAVCRRVVRGLYAWCQGCSHGGHLLHMKAWMEKYQLCPAGCGHKCQLG